MKKNLLIIFFIFDTFITFAQEFVITLKKDLILTNDFGTEYNYKKGDNFIYKIDKDGFGVSIDDPLRIKIYFNDSENNRYDSLITDVYLADYSLKINENVKKEYWIPSYYYEVLKSSDIKESLLTNETYWKDKTVYSRYDDFTWIDEFGVLRYYFDDFYFVIFGNSGYYDVDFFSCLEEVSDSKIIYNVQKMYSHFFDYKREQMAYPNQPEFLPLFEKETPFKIILTIDGDYMKMYIDEISEGNLFQTLVRTTPDVCNQIENWIKGISNDLSNVTWPRHADGTCDYEDISSVKTVSSSTTNVSPNKTMTVAENLKLRSGEATTSDVLTVMQAGTKVKILELGKSETIDGVSSNWVKVEVQSGAKDREGNTISRGTVGWCYGGYLAETTEANNFESTDTKEISDIKIEEAPKQEINIGIVCAIIGAVLLLLLVILIFAVRKKKDNP